jgi:hypothetical protein
MKPYAFRVGKADTGCCPGHDWPRLYRWSGKYSSPASQRTSAKLNKRAKRIRRRVDKAIRLEEE